MINKYEGLVLSKDQACMITEHKSCPFCGKEIHFNKELTENDVERSLVIESIHDINQIIIRKSFSSKTDFFWKEGDIPIPEKSVERIILHTIRDNFSSNGVVNEGTICSIQEISNYANNLSEDLIKRFIKNSAKLMFWIEPYSDVHLKIRLKNNEIVNLK